MLGNIFGKLFTLSIFGESHGPAIGCIISGCPPEMNLCELDIQIELNKRKPGTSIYVTQRSELDKVEILSGVFKGKTTGTPISLLIRNIDHRSKDYKEIKNIFRPGHADYVYLHKYGIRDYNGGGYSSARLTAASVAGGAIAKKWLFEKYNIFFLGCVSEIGEIKIPFRSWKDVHTNIFSLANFNYVLKIKKYIKNLIKIGDSCGARINIIVKNLPIGLGDPIFDKLDANIAYALMGINAVKGVEIGAGFNSIKCKGSFFNDEITLKKFLSNNSGGILGGISNGQDIVISIAVKPTSSIKIPKLSIDVSGKPVIVKSLGRHDPCVGIRIIPIIEAMLALLFMDHILRNKSQCLESNKKKN
ncbi:chorismate synthase [Candidatus Zinderia endosymbiont of Aphrophora alni]|uniref:chorismate synthase n=1 Tax=Candidatus Zinderia endosymbiont of Aphrophora alni TaxID=3077951 RepID=UPI0030CE4A6D